MVLCVCSYRVVCSYCLTPQIKGTPGSMHISHIAPLASLKNLVIGNGDSTIFMLMEDIYFCCTLPISHYCIFHSFTSFDVWKFDIFLDCQQMWFWDIQIIISCLNSIVWRTQFSFLVNPLVGS